jgi:hypothetical protein
MPEKPRNAPKIVGNMRMLQCQSAKIDCKVEVGTRKGLDDGESEKEIAARDPARIDNV